MLEIILFQIEFEKARATKSMFDYITLSCKITPPRLDLYQNKRVCFAYQLLTGFICGADLFLAFWLSLDWSMQGVNV